MVIGQLCTVRCACHLRESQRTVLLSAPLPNTTLLPMATMLISSNDPNYGAAPPQTFYFVSNESIPCWLLSWSQSNRLVRITFLFPFPPARFDSFLGRSDYRLWLWECNTVCLALGGHLRDWRHMQTCWALETSIQRRFSEITTGPSIECLLYSEAALCTVHTLCHLSLTIYLWDE